MLVSLLLKMFRHEIKVNSLSDFFKMTSTDISKITTDRIILNLFSEKKVQVSVLRLDKIHPVISGNKWFKLRYYLEEARRQNKKTIVTFGGAWSNHIIATAAAGKENDFCSIGIIRGEEPRTLSPTLLHAKELGMQLRFISRDEYRLKKVPAELLSEENYFIAEGGYGIKGTEGAATILDQCKKEIFTHMCCAAGTGTMMAGLAKSALPEQEVIGFSVLKNNFTLEENVKALLLSDKKKIRFIQDYHFGGYAKSKQELIEFMNKFYRETAIPSDFVYTAKMFYGILDLINKNYFLPDSHLLLVHSGGLQGNASMDKGTLIF